MYKNNKYAKTIFLLYGNDGCADPFGTECL